MQMGKGIRVCLNQGINKANGKKEEYGCQNQEELYWNQAKLISECF